MAGYFDLKQLTKIQRFNPRINNKSDISLYCVLKIPIHEAIHLLRIKNVFENIPRCLFVNQSQFNTHGKTLSSEFCAKSQNPKGRREI